MKDEFKDILSEALLNIQSNYQQLKPSEKKVADYVRKNVDSVILESITKLSEKAEVSEATVVKFCKSIGYSGYRELKIRLAKSQNSIGFKDEHLYGEINQKDDIENIIKKIFKIYEQSFQNTKKLLLIADIKKAVGLLEKVNKIYFFGFGASGIVAEDSELKFKRISWSAEAVIDNHSQKTIASLLDNKSLVIAITDSGQTRELIESCRIAKNAGAKIIAITSNIGSIITNIADLTLLTFSKESSFRGSAMASRMVQLAVIDVLFLAAASRSFEDAQEALEKTRMVMEKP